MANRWAVLIGVNGYHESLGPLHFCTNDAQLMHETLSSECCGFPSDNIVLLTDDQPKDRLPTFGNIHSWLGTWLSRPGPDDLVLVYFAGHGREANGQALLAPLDATLDSLPVTGIPIPYVRDLLHRCKASQKVVILDACHSGVGRDVATMTTGFREALNAGKGLYTIASCDANHISYEWPEKQHGVFTHYVVEAIRHGAPVGADGRVSLDRVYESARNGILAWTAGKRLKQEPVRICRVKGDIHIASRPLSLEQRLAAAESQINTQRETINGLRAGAERLADENTALPKELEKKSEGVHTKSTRVFTPSSVRGSGFFGRTRKYDRLISKISFSISPYTPSGRLEIPLGEWVFEAKSHRDMPDKINGALQRAFGRRGFRTVSGGGEVVVEALRYGCRCNSAYVQLEIRVKDTEQILWKGKVHLPSREL